MGYAWVAQCDEEGCETIIDRGLSHCCGGMHEGEVLYDHQRDESASTCGGYFCEAHLQIVIGFDDDGNDKGLDVCALCAEHIKALIGNYDEWPESYVSREGVKVMPATDRADGQIG